MRTGTTGNVYIYIDIYNGLVCGRRDEDGGGYICTLFKKQNPGRRVVPVSE